MTQIRNFVEVERVLAGYVMRAKDLMGKDITLERMRPLMTLLGNPEKKLKIVHVAGTSGKTSTAYFMAALLHGTGKKVGLTVSPHLDSVAERVQINLEPLSEADFCANLGEFIDLIHHIQSEPTYFELIIAFAYWYFAKVGVDYAVIETGLGGLYDASNVADEPNKVCIITDIGFDHMHVLGHTIPEIAAQKAGIIHTQNQVFMYGQSDEVNRVFQQKTELVHATLNVLSEREERENMLVPDSLKHLPIYQQRNWLLAYKTYEYLHTRDQLTPMSWEFLNTSLYVQVPGRMDIKRVGTRNIVMDGAHNGQKVQAFVQSFQAMFPGEQAAILLSLKEGKEYENVLPLLLPICSCLILTTFQGMQDLPIHSIATSVLKQAAVAAGFKAVETYDNPDEAYRNLYAKPDDLLIITGSFYLLSRLRPTIMKQSD